MAVKAQTPPPLNSASQPSQSIPEDRFTKVSPEVNQRLDAFIQNNSKLNDYYSQLVKEHPDRAVRSFMLNKMFKLEGEMRTVNRMAPQAKEWLEKQTPEVQQRVHERIEKYSPMYREKAAVRIIGQEKAKLDFTPRAAVGGPAISA